MALDDPTIENVIWWSYMQHHSGGASQSEIAKRVGVTPSAVGRWRKSQPDSGSVARFARSYKRPVLEAMIAAGHITSEDAQERPSAPPSLASLDDDELLAEVRARMKGERTWEPGSSGPEEGDSGGATVHQLPSATADPDNPFTVWEADGAAADQQDDEPVGDRLRRQQDEDAEHGQ